MSKLIELCGICNQPEGKDPKAHNCTCFECGSDFDGYEPICDCNEEGDSIESK